MAVADHVIWCTPCVGNRFRCAALTGLLVLAGASSDAQPSVRYILLLQSVDRGSLTIDAFTGNFRADLERRAGSPVNVDQVNIRSTELVGPPEQAVVDFI